MIDSAPFFRRRRLKPWLWLIVVTSWAVGFFSTTGADKVRPDRFKAVPSVNVPPEGIKELRQARQMDTARTQEFNTQVRKALQWFPEITATQQFGTNRFHRLTLNQHGAGFDAVRFKAPPGTNDAYDLVWVFGSPLNRKFNWYILPVEGEMNGFRNFNHWSSDHLAVICPWNRLAEDYLGILQSLSGGEIKPGHEYVIWFKFQQEGPMDFFLALNLVPKGTPLLQEHEQLRALDLQ